MSHSSISTIIVLSIWALTVLNSCWKTKTEIPAGVPVEQSANVAGEKAPALSEIEIARRRVALRSIIRKGDYYQARNEAFRAIEYYEQAHWEIHEDAKVTVRLANAYFEVKQFRKAADLFLTQDITDFDEPSKLRVIASILFDQKRTDTASIIDKLALKKETKEYLKVLTLCANTPDKCIEIIRQSVSTDIHIKALQTVIKNAQETSSDPVFVEALVIGKLYENRAFLAVKNLSNAVLAKRPDYRVILKIAGYASYELWEYKEAASLLDKNYQSDTQDITTAYTLWIIYFYKEDYTTSNLYFNAAILGGYTPKLELERRLIYNYALLGDANGAFKVFRHLLSSSEASPEDYLVALYMAEQSNEFSKARLWSLRAVEKFPNDASLLAFASISERRSGDPLVADSMLEQALSVDTNNSLALLEKAKSLRVIGRYSEAQILIETLLWTTPIEYFKKSGEDELILIKNGLAATTTILPDTTLTGSIFNPQ